MPRYAANFPRKEEIYVGLRGCRLLEVINSKTDDAG